MTVYDATTAEKIGVSHHPFLTSGRIVAGSITRGGNQFTYRTVDGVASDFPCPPCVVS